VISPETIVITSGCLEEGIAFEKDREEDIFRSG